MKLRIVLFALTGMMIILLSCQKEDDSDLIAMEDRIFNAFLESKDITTEPTESGLYFISEEEGTGISPEEGDWALINYDLYLVDGEQLIFTTDKDKAIGKNVYDSRVIYGNSKIQIGSNLEGLDEGLTMMKEGGTAELLFQSDLGYGKNGAGVIGPYNSLLVKVELIEVIKDPVMYEEEKIAKYLSESDMIISDTLESGLIYVEMNEGTGDSAMRDYKVGVNIEGYLLDGRMFMDEEVFQFQLGKLDYAVTQGLTEGVSYMKVGGKARLIVPYYLGYGEMGKSYYEGVAKVPIPPYTTLIYDVELLNTKIY
ncbi:MAG: FKBP-type peptidyl-prolyl cis-trans isomerase [Bacteroidota bacterium]